MSHSSTLTPSITPELTATLRRLKLGQLIDTLPERLALAKSSKMSYAEFLQLLLADEVSRRDTTSAAWRWRTRRWGRCMGSPGRSAGCFRRRTGPCVRVCCRR